MKFSSIPLIAAALAIASSVIAAPSPFHARDLEELTSSKRDLDAYHRKSGVAVLEREVDGGLVDNLTRRSATKQYIAHSSVAEKCYQASSASTKAAYNTHVASILAITNADKKHYQETSEHHREIAKELKEKGDAHKRAASLPSTTPLLNAVETDARYANHAKGNALGVSSLAQQEMKKFEQERRAMKAKGHLFDRRGT